MNTYVKNFSMLACIFNISMQATQLTIHYKELFKEKPKYIMKKKNGTINIHLKGQRPNGQPCIDMNNIPLRNIKTSLTFDEKYSGEIFATLYDDSLDTCDVSSIDYSIDITKPLKGSIKIDPGLDHILVTINGEGTATVERK